MKKWVVGLLITALMLSGCQVVTAEPPPSEPSLVHTEPLSETGAHTEPSAQPTDAAEPTGMGCVDADVPEGDTEWVTLGYCVDCGAGIYDPAAFDPYHCAGCGDSGFFSCTDCGQRIPGVASIRRMCIDCYWSSGSTGGCCVLCGGGLDVQVANGIVCFGCYQVHGDKINQVILQPGAQTCSVCNQVSTCGAYLVNGEFACAECGGQPIPLGGAICNTCGLPYGEGEGFEWLCFDCQKKYGPKCSVCGTDCTYRGTIDGMCDECYNKTATRLHICHYCGRSDLTENQMYNESFCIDCVETYFWYCGVCGDRLPENTGVPNQCEKCTYCGICGEIAYSGGQWVNGVFTCPSCLEKEQSGECAQCGQECVGTWVGAYYVCDTCAQMRPCALCGTHYYIWEMFEGVCFDCDDPSGGAADGL